MKLTIASQKAKLFACKNFHYSKSLPVNTFGYNVYNNNNEWCGVILYGLGANNNIAKRFKLNQGEVIELVRVALNGKQEQTSKALAISLKLIKNDCKVVKKIISYADFSLQNHTGIIYKATNWELLEKVDSNRIKGAYYEIDGDIVHGRIVRNKYGTDSKIDRPWKYYDKPLYKYLYLYNLRQ